MIHRADTSTWERTRHHRWGSVAPLREAWSGWDDFKVRAGLNLPYYIHRGYLCQIAEWKRGKIG